MLHHAVRPLLRVALLSVLLGAVPPAPVPVVRATVDRAATVAGPPVVAAAPVAPLVAPASTPVPHPEPPPPSLPAHASGTATNNVSLSSLPLAFVPNVGQTDAQVRYHAQALGGNVFFMPNAVVLALPIWSITQTLNLPDKWSHTRPITTSVIGLDYIGANSTPTIVSAAPLPGVTNFLHGNNRANWHTNIATYAGITYQQLYPGIDLHFDGAGRQLKSTYSVAPGADPTRIRWHYRGAAQVQTDATGNLLIIIDSRLQATQPVTITEAAPTAWQLIGGQRVPVTVHYLVAANNSISFDTSGYDTRYALTIDPTLAYNTVFGGSSSESGYGIAVDSAGNAYIAGSTASPDFPTNSEFGTGGLDDVFVTKMDPSGTQRLYSTYIGGSDADGGLGIAVDSAGNAYIAGYAGAGFPTTIGAYDMTFNSGSRDAIVTKLNPDGNGLVYSTYLGGNIAILPES